MIDWNRVAELRDEIGADGLAEVVDMFLAEADGVIARLSPDLGAQVLENDYHFLKGAALNLGFVVMAHLCQARETAAKAGQITSDLTELNSIYHNSRAALIAGL